MEYEAYGIGEFVNAALLNQAEASTQASFAAIGQGLHTPGVIPNGLTFGISGLVLTWTFALPSGALFGSGVLAQGHGNVNGTDNNVYPVDTTPLLPLAGSVVIYFVATASTIGLGPVAIVGPPVGHPDYDPSFIPYTLFSTITDTLVVIATTTPADNYTTIELARTTLSAGQTVLTSIDITERVLAGSQLSQNGEVTSADLAPTGVIPGSYAAPLITVGADGRLTFAGAANTGIVPGSYISPNISVGSDGRLISATNNFAGSLAASGWTILPNGLKMQWGSATILTVAAGNTVTNVTLPDPFAAHGLWAIANWSGTTPPAGGSVSAIPNGVGSILVAINVSFAGSFGVTWQALGN